MGSSSGLLQHQQQQQCRRQQQQPGPVLCFVLLQEQVVECVVQAPVVFGELESLDLSGLGLGDAGAVAMAEVLKGNPALGELSLADNGIGQEGAAALADALQHNTALQVSGGGRGWRQRVLQCGREGR
jgi:hypothetical protein